MLHYEPDILGTDHVVALFFRDKHEEDDFKKGAIQCERSNDAVSLELL